MKKLTTRLLLLLALLLTISACSQENTDGKDSASGADSGQESALSDEVSEEKSTAEPDQNESDKTQEGLKDGVYEASGTGHNGKLTIATTVEGGEIKSIEIKESVETSGIGGKAIDLISDKMIEKQSVNVDQLTGATVSSATFKKLVGDSLLEAGATEEWLDGGDRVSVFEPAENMEADVVIIGAGGTGMTAAITAKQSGASVVIIERNGYAGGNTMVSGGGLNVPATDLQAKNNIEGDSVDRYIEDTLKGGDYKNSVELVTVMANNALDAYEWLRDDIQVPFLQERVQQFGGHSLPRACVPEGNTGSTITDALIKKCEELDIPILYETLAQGLIQEGDRVTGVKAVQGNRELTFTASKGVIIATGGFGANIEMRNKYNPDYGERFMTTCLPSSQGDGIRMAEKVNAGLVDMDYIQVYPTCNPVTGIISYVANSRFDGGILVNKEGRRFTNEGGRRDEISQAILSQTDGIGYLVWGEEIESVGRMSELHLVEFQQMVDQGLIIKAESLEEAAEFIEIDMGGLRETLDKWNSYVDKEEDPDFEKTGAYRKILEGPYFIQKVTPSTHHTMGGITIDTEGRVLDKDGEPILGLYAGGEVCGGIHGTNRLGGNAITDVTVFGRIAGRSAAEGK